MHVVSGLRHWVNLRLRKLPDADAATAILAETAVGVKAWVEDNRNRIPTPDDAILLEQQFDGECWICNSAMTQRTCTEKSTGPGNLSTALHVARS
jgi:hypothetical protein